MIGLICVVSEFVFIGVSQVCDCQLCSILFFLLSFSGWLHCYGPICTQKLCCRIELNSI